MAKIFGRALRAEHERPFDVDPATAWLEQFHWAIQRSAQLPTIDASAVPLYLGILEDSDRVATMATTDPTDPRHRQHTDVQRRANAMLNRHHPSLAPTTGVGPSTRRAFPRS